MMKKLGLLLMPALVAGVFLFASRPASAATLTVGCSGSTYPTIPSGGHRCQLRRYDSCLSGNLR